MIFADILMWFFLITGTYVVLISYWLTSQGLFPAFVDRCRKRIEASPVRQALLGLSVTVPLAATGIVMLNAPSRMLKFLGAVLLLVAAGRAGRFGGIGSAGGLRVVGAG